MTSLEILIYPDARLKQVSEPVTNFNSELQCFTRDLEAVMRVGPGAVGIAAPQVGRSQRIVIVDISPMMAARHKPPPSSDHGRMLLINPKIVESQGEIIAREGCLSVPDYTGNVKRASAMKVQAQDVNGVSHEWHCTGFEARVVQHELDHLDGILFIDRIVSTQQLFRRKVYKST